MSQLSLSAQAFGNQPSFPVPAKFEEELIRKLLKMMNVFYINDGVNLLAILSIMSKGRVKITILHAQG